MPQSKVIPKHSLDLPMYIIPENGPEYRITNRLFIGIQKVENRIIPRLSLNLQKYMIMEYW